MGGSRKINREIIMGGDDASLKAGNGDASTADGQTPSVGNEANPVEANSNQSQPQQGLTQEEIANIFAGLSTEKGRLVKETEEARIAREEYHAKVKELDERILNGLKDDPAKLSLAELQIKTRNDVEALRVKQDEFKKQQEAFNKEKSEYEAYKFERTLNSIATKYNVSADILKKTGITDTETLDRVASFMKPSQNVVQKPVDSGKGNGGLSDKEWLRLFNKGKEGGIPATLENIARAKSIIMKE